MSQDATRPPGSNVDDRQGTHRDDGQGTHPDDRPRLVSAIFGKLERAAKAESVLRERGYRRDQICVFTTAEAGTHFLDTAPEPGAREDHAVLVDQVTLERRVKALEGAALGGAAGGLLGAVGAAVLAARATLTFPPLGITVAGPLAAALAGAGAGATVGGVVGALLGSGLSEYRARRFEEMLSGGDIVVSVEALTEPELVDIAGILEKHGGELVGKEEA